MSLAHRLALPPSPACSPRRFPPAPRSSCTRICRTRWHWPSPRARAGLPGQRLCHLGRGRLSRWRNPGCDARRRAGRTPSARMHGARPTPPDPSSNRRRNTPRSFGSRFAAPASDAAEHHRHRRRRADQSRQQRDRRRRTVRFAGHELGVRQRRYRKDQRPIAVASFRGAPKARALESIPRAAEVFQRSFCLTCDNGFRITAVPERHHIGF